MNEWNMNFSREKKKNNMFCIFSRFAEKKNKTRFSDLNEWMTNVHARGKKKIRYLWHMCSQKRKGRVIFSLFKILDMLEQRYRIFFFSAGMDVGHSFIQIRKSCFFFFPRSGKKKIQTCFFLFPRKSWSVIHSDFYGVPFFLTVVGCIFFFPQFCLFFVCFFLSTEKFTCHSFIRSQSCFFFFSGFGKNKKQYFHSFNRFFSKSAQKRTFPGKKKNTVPLLRIIKKRKICEWLLVNYDRPITK